MLELAGLGYPPGSKLAKLRLFNLYQAFFFFIILSDTMSVKMLPVW